MRRALSQSFARVEFINPSPYLFLVLNFSNTNCRNISSWFDYPGGRNTLHVVPNVIVAQEWNKIGYVKSRCLCFHTHCKFVAEESRGGTRHAGYTEMFADLRRRDYIIFFKCDNPINLLLPVQ